MVFDEVDAGVGGRAAVEIGRRLARLARNHQVIVVTHLPQVAAFADHHVVIGKGRRRPHQHGPDAARDERGRIGAHAGGAGDTDTGRAHAEELLATACRPCRMNTVICRFDNPSKAENLRGLPK